jgi:hypothetical protein
MELFHIVVLVAAALCALVAGFLFGFAVVAMPGLKNLSDRDGKLFFFGRNQRRRPQPAHPEREGRLVEGEVSVLRRSGVLSAHVEARGSTEHS